MVIFNCEVSSPEVRLQERTSISIEFVTPGHVFPIFWIFLVAHYWHNGGQTLRTAAVDSQRFYSTHWHIGVLTGTLFSSLVTYPSCMSLHRLSCLDTGACARSRLPHRALPPAPLCSGRRSPPSTMFMRWPVCRRLDGGKTVLLLPAAQVPIGILLTKEC